MPREKDFLDVIAVLDASPISRRTRTQLDWRRLSHPAGFRIYVADVSPQRAAAVMRAMPFLSKRLPIVGNEVLLAQAREGNLWLENRSGEYCLKVV